MKIDMHNHTTLSSLCSVLNVRDLIDYARRMELDGICVTEHDTLHGGRIAEEIGRESGFLVIGAQEVSCIEGDVLAFGIYEENLSDIPVRQLCELAAETGAVLIPAHPYRTTARSMGDTVFEFPHCFPALEGLNGNASDEQNQRAIRSAHKMGIQIVGGSDAHSIKMVGRYYTDFSDDVTIHDLDSLINALKTTQYRAMANPKYMK